MTHTAMTLEYATWCKNNNYPHISANELLTALERELEDDNNKSDFELIKKDIECINNFINGVK